MSSYLVFASNSHLAVLLGGLLHENNSLFPGTTKNVLQLWNPGSDSSVMQVEKDGQKHISVMVEDGSMQVTTKALPRNTI